MHSVGEITIDYLLITDLLSVHNDVQHCGSPVAPSFPFFSRSIFSFFEEEAQKKNIFTFPSVIVLMSTWTTQSMSRGLFCLICRVHYCEVQLCSSAMGLRLTSTTGWLWLFGRRSWDTWTPSLKSGVWQFVNQNSSSIAHWTTHKNTH